MEMWKSSIFLFMLVHAVCTGCFFIFVCVKVWLSELSAEMKETLKHMLLECVAAGRKGEVNPARYPSQVGLGHTKGPTHL